MGRKGLVSAMMIAGLAQMAPAVAQVQGEPQDMGPPPVVQEAPPAAPAPARVSQAVDDGFRAPAPVAAPAPAVVAQTAPHVQVAEAAPEVDPADRDLAEAPGEEMRPSVIDPSTGKPMPVNPLRGTRMKTVHIVPQPRLAGEVVAPTAAVPAEAVAVAAPVRHEAQPVVATAQSAPQVERVAAAPVQVASADEQQPAYVEEEEHGDEANHVGLRQREPAYAVEEYGDEANHVNRPANDPTVYARAVRAAIPGALNNDQAVRRGADVADRAPAPVYAQDERAAAPVYAPAPPAYAPAPQVYAPAPRVEPPVYAQDDRDSAPVYAQDERDSAPVYAQDDRQAPQGYDNRYPDEGSRYAMQDRDVRPVLAPAPRNTWQDGNRSADRACDGARAGLLQQRLLREARQGMIARRAAQDIDAELGNADELRQSYCASGMNEWRQDRLERQFAQIEDRIRYEEGNDRGPR